MFLAVGADTGHFDHRVVDREPEAVRLGQQFRVAIFEFGDTLTVTADQELRGGAFRGMTAGDERVAALDAVNQTLGKQEIERAVNNRWSDSLVVVVAVQRGQNIVGAKRLVAREQDFKHLSTPGRQPQAARLAELTRL